MIWALSWSIGFKWKHFYEAIGGIVYLPGSWVYSGASILCISGVADCSNLAAKGQKVCGHFVHVGIVVQSPSRGNCDNCISTLLGICPAKSTRSTG